MRVRDLMRGTPRYCTPGHDLGTIGRLMGEVGCGVLPVVGDGERVVGVITDRDVCLALTRRDQKPSQVEVGQVFSGDLFACRADEELTAALQTMRRHRVRRLPVIDAENRLKGILSLDEIVLHSRPVAETGIDAPVHAEIAETLKAINQHPTPVPA